MGVAIALDDFGTGYSSLSYLKRFPLSKLKIDRSFIRDVLCDEDDAAITQAIISMALALKINVIAEGIETEEQLDFLCNLDCHYGQGYYFSRPIPAEDYTLLLQAEDD
ncbi:MAG: EAL domain-containing protein [Deltaproteobacteria bacterium]|nr:EAL domain-containing protein [Deltaproteobacteria bacterium]